MTALVRTEHRGAGKGRAAAPSTGLVSITNKGEQFSRLGVLPTSQSLHSVPEWFKVGPPSIGTVHAFDPTQVQPPASGRRSRPSGGTGRGNGYLAQCPDRAGTEKLPAVCSQTVPAVDHGCRSAITTAATSSGALQSSAQGPAGIGVQAGPASRLRAASRRSRRSKYAVPLWLAQAIPSLPRQASVKAWTLGGSTDPEGVATFGFGPEHAARAAAEMYALARTDDTYRDASQFRAALVDLFGQVLERLPQPRRGGVQ